MSLTYFSDALEQLANALPSHWATDVPTSEVSILLQAFGELVDELSAEVEAIYADQSLDTATFDGLLREWAHVYGVDNEQLPPTVDALRAYIKERAADDGTISALEQQLLALLRASNPGVTIAGLTFPFDGSGLDFPGDGSGLTFPANGAFTITEHLSDHVLEVDVDTTLIFDRNAFDRAVDRFRPADTLYEIVEV